MASYAESLLADGEVVLMRQRQHPLTIVFDGRAGLALWIIGIVLLFALVFFNIAGTARDLMSVGALIAIVLGLVIFAWNWWHWRTEEYLVTNRRLLKVSGIVNKESADSSLEKINDAILHQDLFARILDYGDLEIMTAAEVSVDHYHMLHHAKAFKIEMLNAKHTLEHEVAYVAMPSPPLRSGDASGGTGNAGSAAGPSAAAAPAYTAAPPPAYAAAPAPAAPAWSSTPFPAPAAEAPGTPAIDTTDEVTQTLAKLADLRDRGAITATDYDAKKAELLGRL